MVCLVVICSRLHGTSSLNNDRDVRSTDKPVLQYIESHNDDVTEVGSSFHPLITFVLVGLLSQSNTWEDAASKPPYRRRCPSSYNIIIA